MRFGIVDFYGGDSGLASAELAQVTTAGVLDTGYSGDGHSPSTMNRHRYGELQDLVARTRRVDRRRRARSNSFQQAVVVVRTTPDRRAGSRVRYRRAGGAARQVAPSDIVVGRRRCTCSPTAAIAVLYQPHHGRPATTSSRQPATLSSPPPARSTRPSAAATASVDVGFEDVEQAVLGAGGQRPHLERQRRHPRAPRLRTRSSAPTMPTRTCFVQKVSLTGAIVRRPTATTGRPTGWPRLDYTALFESSQTADRRGGRRHGRVRRPHGRERGHRRSRASRSGGSSPPARRTPGFGVGGIRAGPGGSADSDVDAALHLARRAGGGVRSSSRMRHSGGPHDALAAPHHGRRRPLDTTFSGDGRGDAHRHRRECVRIQDAVLQGDQPLFLGMNACRPGRRCSCGLTAAGAPDTTLGPGGALVDRLRSPAYDSAAPATHRLVDRAAPRCSARRSCRRRQAGVPEGVDIELVKIQTSAPAATAPGAPTGVSATAGTPRRR